MIIRGEKEARDEEVVGDYLGAAADHMERAQGEREEPVIHRKVFSERVFRVRNVFTMNCSSTPAAPPPLLPHPRPPVLSFPFFAINRTSSPTFVRFRCSFPFAHSIA